MKVQVTTVKIVSRAALGMVWLYEGLVPKILFMRPDEVALVRNSGIVWRTPEWTLLILGIAQVAFGLWLIIGWAERLAVALATIWMVVLIILVGAGNPAMLTDPYGALIKDLCLLACAFTVWALAPGRSPKGAKTIE